MTDEVTYSDLLLAAQGLGFTCDACGATIMPHNLDTHTAFHLGMVKGLATIIKNLEKLMGDDFVE